MRLSKTARRLVVSLVTCLFALAGPAGIAGPKKVTLGTDPDLDAPPGADLIQLDASRAGKDLVLGFHLSGMLPVQGTYPGAGVEWMFDVGSRTFVAEGYPDIRPGEFGYSLFEIDGDTFHEVGTLEGEVDWAAGHMTLFVPLDLVDAKRGTRISGTGDSGDVNIHIHAGTVTEYFDEMTTTRDFVVP